MCGEILDVSEGKVVAITGESLGPHQDLPPAVPVGDEDLSCCSIIPGKETTIEIAKEKSGLGLSIVGGSDTLLVDAASLVLLMLLLMLNN